MRILFRHFLVALLPLVLGLGAGWGFALTQDKCGRLVGPVFAPKCHWIQLEYQILFMMIGTALGCILAAVLGTWLELRSRRVVQRADPNPGEPS